VNVDMKQLFITICFLFVLIGCGSQTTHDYKETKSIVLDILKTDDAKKAIREANTVSDKELINSAEIQANIEESFSNPENQNAFKEMLKDPKVAKSFAKAIEEEHKRLMKDMMKDPEYQQMMIKVLNDPQAQETLLKTMNSTTYQ